MSLLILALFAPSTSISSQTKVAKNKSGNNASGCLDRKHKKFKFIVSLGVINSKAIDIPIPKYSIAAKALNISGEVKVRIIVDKKGNVFWGHIETGHPILQTAVKEVVCQARFKPQIISGNPVPVYGIIIYNFSRN